MLLNLLLIILIVLGIVGVLVCVFFVYSCFVVSSRCSREEEQNIFLEKIKERRNSKWKIKNTKILE